MFSGRHATVTAPWGTVEGDDGNFEVDGGWFFWPSFWGNCGKWYILWFMTLSWTYAQTTLT